MNKQFPDDREFTLTMRELREEVAKQCLPLEAAAFEAGKREGLRGAVLERAEKVVAAPAAKLDAYSLAALARKIEVELGCTNAEACREAYKRAGLSIT